MFRLKWLADGAERTLGVTFRLFGIDFSLALVGFINDWRLIDLRIPCERGISLQIWFLFLAIGRLENGFYE
jgi:hypothetical protein